MKSWHYKEKVLSEEKVYSGKIIDVVKETVKLPDGNLSCRDIVHHVPAVAIIVINNDDQILVVHQWRSAVRAMTIEIPAGKMDYRDTSPLEAAIRELNEETRLEAGELKLITSFYSSIGFADEEIFLYQAKDLRNVSKVLPQDKDEQLSLEWLNFSIMEKMFIEGKLNDSKTSFAFLYWKMLRLKAVK